MHELLMHCYKKFYSAGDMAKKILRLALGRWDLRTVPAMKMLLGYAALQRISAMGGDHPMSGGGGRVRLDGVAGYAALRREFFGLDLVPLPHSLALSARDEALNRTVKLHA